MYTQPVGQVSSGSVAYMESSIFQQLGPNCHLQFWYYMYDVGQELLVVYLKTTSGRFNLWHASDSSEKVWKQAVVKLGFQFQVRIEIEATYDSSANNHYIAIDDISFINCTSRMLYLSVCLSVCLSLSDHLCVYPSEIMNNVTCFPQLNQFPVPKGTILAVRTTASLVIVFVT